MLPPQSGGIAQQPFLHRLWDPARLIDWHEALINFEYALLRPSKLAKQSVQRHHIINRLSRDDPGLVLLVLLMTVLTGPLFYLGVRPRGALLQGFLMRPLWLLGGFWLLGAAALYVAVVYLLTVPTASPNLSRWGLRADRIGQHLKAKLRRNADPAGAGGTASALKKRANEQALPHILIAKLDESSRFYLNYDLYLHCLDTVLNAATPWLFVLGPLQFLLLPALLPPAASLATTDDALLPLADGAVSNLLRCFSSNTVHAFAIGAGCHALVCNLKILPAPASALAGYAWIAALMSTLLLAVSTMLRFNANQLFLAWFYGIY